MYYYILARACMCQNSEVGALKAGGVKEGEAGDSRQEVMRGVVGRQNQGHGDSQETVFGMTLR